MDTARLTDERLRFGLNSDQALRERMCMSVLALDRSYSDIYPRRPEGGPDGGRDIECKRLGETCFGAVGFKNSVNDSNDDKKTIRKKFKADVDSALGANSNVKSFVFFTNVDFTPGEIEELKSHASKKGHSYVDIYWRERVRQALDSVEGLATRFQYLGINLSDAEQAAFFGRYGKDLEELLLGRFDRIEKKIDEMEFARWKDVFVRSVALDVDFLKVIESRHDAPEHFRVAMQLQSTLNEKRGIILGARDDFWPAENGKHFFGTKSFIHRQQSNDSKASWVQKSVRAGGGVITGIHIDLSWWPHSPIRGIDFDGLSPDFFFSENLRDRIKRVRFIVDDYVLLEWEFSEDGIGESKPILGWPDEMTVNELEHAWCSKHLWGIRYDDPPPKAKSNSTHLMSSDGKAISFSGGTFVASET